MPLTATLNFISVTHRNVPNLRVRLSEGKSGASGEIQTLKHLFLRQACYSNSHTLALWCTGEDLNLRVPLGETGLQPVRFGRAHAPVQTWRKVDESNAHRSSRCPGFQDQLPAIQQYLPHGGEYGS